MKQIILIVPLVFLLNYGLITNGYAQCQIFGDAHKPKGKIKSFIEECYTVGNGVNYLQLKTGYIYDQGLLVEQDVYKPGADSDVVNTAIKYVYSKGKLISENASGQDITMNGVPGNTGYQIKYAYDFKGNRIEKRYISDFNNYSERYKYDLQNNLIEEDYVGPDGNISSSNKYKYDLNRHKIEDYYKDGDPNGNTGITNFQVDSKGNILLEKAHFPNGNLRYYKTYKYNLRSNLTNENCYAPDGRLIWAKTFTNEYDKYSNWISITSYSNSETTLTRRDLEYFGIVAKATVPNNSTPVTVTNINAAPVDNNFKVFFIDNFEDNKNQWPTKKGDNYNFYIENHNYVMSSEGGGTFEPVIPTNISADNDYHITAILNQVSGVSNSGYGLTFSYKDGGNFYVFEISGEGYYRVCRLLDNQFYTILPWTATDRIFKGNGQQNKLRIWYQGGQICEFYINDVMVNRIDNFQTEGNFTGFVIDNNQTIEAKMLKVEVRN